MATNDPLFVVAEAWAELPGPDYASPAAWLVHGEGQGLAVFYLHPTTYAGDTWNAALDEASAQPGLADVLVSHVGVFRDCCAIWVPRYRQAALMALSDRSGRGEAAYALAYEDVASAFASFLSRIGSQPFILAGHSQGSFHLRRLLEEKVAPVHGIRDQLVAAYVIGIGVPHALFNVGEALYPLAPCMQHTDIGCVASWSLFTDDVGARNFAQVQAGRYPELIGRTGEGRFLCVNPISGRADAIPMPAKNHPGAWMPGASAPVSGVTGLVCRDGALVAIDQLDGAWLQVAFAGGSLHMLDYHLTFSAMQRDVVTRIDAFCASSRCE